MPDHIEEIHDNNGLVYVLHEEGMPTDEAYQNLLAYGAYVGDFFSGYEPDFTVKGFTRVPRPFHMVIDLENMTIIALDHSKMDELTWDEIKAAVRQANK